MSNVIEFYSTSGDFGCFSNFAPYPIEMDGRIWPTSEHYSPMIAARMGRSRKQPLRRDWETVKVGIMREAVRAKFAQHDDIRELLLSTGDSQIVEHTANDSYWGDGGDGSGRNMLGRILMQVRNELSAETGDA